MRVRLSLRHRRVLWMRGLRLLMHALDNCRGRPASAKLSACVVQCDSFYYWTSNSVLWLLLLHWSHCIGTGSILDMTSHGDKHRSDNDGAMSMHEQESEWFHQAWHNVTGE